MPDTWPVLFFDPGLTGGLNLNILRQTATDLARKHQEHDSVCATGIMLVQQVFGLKRNVLHFTTEGAQ